MCWTCKAFPRSEVEPCMKCGEPSRAVVCDDCADKPALATVEVKPRG